MRKYLFWSIYVEVKQEVFFNDIKPSDKWAESLVRHIGMKICGLEGEHKWWYILPCLNIYFYFC